MTVKAIKICLLVLWLFPVSGLSQKSKGTAQDCKEMLMSYLDKMEAIDSPGEGQVYHVKYQMKTIFDEQFGLDSEIVDTEVFTSNSQIALYDNKMSVFGDSKHVFVVLPEYKKIYWNNSDPRIFSDTNTYKKFLKIQRTLLESTSNISCTAKDKIVQIKVVPRSDFRAQTNLVEQQVSYDTKNKRIVEVQNLYSSKSKMKSQTISYEILDFNSSKRIVGPVAALFEGNRLKSKYKGFEIIDNRQN